MRRINTISMAIVALVCSACAPDLTCSDPEPYQAAVETKKVTAAEGLDELQEANEMSIPRASPQDARDADDPCLDLPPTIQASPSTD